MAERAKDMKSDMKDDDCTREAPNGRVHYTAFIRLPFPRGEFEDPPLVDWDASKDKALWKILSGNPRSAELNWKELAARFDVTLPFILQQAAWLYERQLSQVREQMRRVSKNESALEESEERDGEVGAATAAGAQPPHQRRPSARFAIPSHSIDDAQPTVNDGPAIPTDPDRELSSEVRGENTVDLPLRAAASPIMRTASSNTVTQSSHRPASRGGVRSRTSTQRGTPPDRLSLTSRRLSQHTAQRPRSPSPPSQSSKSSSPSESDDEKVQPKRSQYLRRPPKFTSARRPSFRGSSSRADLDSDEEQDERPFLPFSQAADEHQDLGATLRGQGQAGDSQTDGSSDAAPVPETTKIDSSMSSAASSAVPVQSRDTPLSQRSPESDRMSPRRRAERAAWHARRKGKGREGSEGTPSMDSSFSDLDDTSVTRSTLEEALLSEQRGMATSRISNLSQALRSQYSRYQESSSIKPQQHRSAGS